MLSIVHATRHPSRPSLLPRETIQDIKPRTPFKTSKISRPQASKPRVSPTRCQALPDWFTKIINYRSWARRAARTWKFKEYDADVERKIKNKNKKDNSKSMEEHHEIIDQLQKQVDEMRAIEMEKEEKIRRQMREKNSSSIPPPSIFNSPLLPLPLPLTGEELVDKIVLRFGVRYDLTFARRDLFGISIVSLNIMWQYLEQRSFPMSEDQYVNKMEEVALTLNTFGPVEVERVRQYFEKGKRIKHPRVGSPLSIRLYIDEENMNRTFGG